MSNVKLLFNDPIGRYKAGEVGKILANDYYGKYDYFIELESIVCGKSTAFTKKGEMVARCYYFYKHEVEFIK